MDCAVHATTTQQRTVGGIHDRVYRLSGYVALDNSNSVFHDAARLPVARPELKAVADDSREVLR
jgi:hypothetical protein